MQDGSLIVGGIFTTAQGAPADYLARWDGTTWQPLGAGPNGPVLDLAVLANGDLVAGGSFHACGSVATNGIARWDGVSWSALGAGTNDRVLAVTEAANGDILAGGLFTTAGGVPCNYIAKWDGTTWNTLGSGMNGAVMRLCTRRTGEVVATGAFSSAGGQAAFFVAQWNGAAWSPLGASIGAAGGTLALLELPNGNVVTGGTGGVGMWDGTTWTTLLAPGPDTVLALLALPNGDLLAGGYLPGHGNLERWDGSAWSTLATGTNIAIYALGMLQNGDVIAGGQLSYLARFTTTCPATATPFGATCSSSGGPMVLSQVTLPWAGATCETSSTGVLSTSLAFGILGFAQQNTPLVQLHPSGVPGCGLLARPDAVAFLPAPSQGSVHWRFAIPNQQAIAGVVLRHQILQLELGPTQQIVGVSGSNGLLLTIGRF